MVTGVWRPCAGWHGPLRTQETVSSDGSGEWTRTGAETVAALALHRRPAGEAKYVVGNKILDTRPNRKPGEATARALA
jgi:hypothetical protein